MTENELSRVIIGEAIKLHRHLGPGLLESAYEHALAFELRQQGFHVNQQVGMPFNYKSVKLEIGYRLDLTVNGKVLVEVKSVEAIAPVHFAQTLTYLKLSEMRLALLINFNNKYLRDGIKRIVNNLPDQI